MIQHQLPDNLCVSVIMEKHPSRNPWVDYVWKAVGVVVGASGYQEVTCLHKQNNTSHYLYPNFPLRLHQDECASYYSNLQSEQAACYVVLDIDQQPDTPNPCLVSLSFDEADAYLQEGMDVQTVPLPPELYRWLEDYVLEHYVPQPIKKRKRQAWHSAVKQGC